MARRTDELASIRECIAKTRGSNLRTCIGCELSRMEVPVDMYQTESNLVIKAFLPEVKPDEVSTSIKQDKVVIKGEHKEDPGISEDDYFYHEHHHGFFNREVMIPIPVQSSKVKIGFANGVLNITFPKELEVKDTKTKVKQKTV